MKLGRNYVNKGLGIRIVELQATMQKAEPTLGVSNLYVTFACHMGN